MGGIPTNYHGEVLTKTDGDPDTRRARPDGARRGGLRLGARRQPARLELADRPRGVRPRRGAALRRDRRRRATKQPELPKDAGRPARWRASTASATPTAARRPPSCALEMQKVMQSNCAVFRTGEVLEEGQQADPRGLDAASTTSRVTDRSLIWNSDLVETLEFDNLIAQAVVTMDSALQPHREPRRPCPRGLSRPRRQELDEAHARLDRRQAAT